MQARIISLLLWPLSYQFATAQTYGPDHSYPVFRTLDENQSGAVEKTEWVRADQLLDKLDQDGNGDLDQAELGGPGPFFGYLRLQTTIRVLDRDGDCVISEQERKHSPAQLPRLDADGDGKLSRAECYDQRVRLGGGQTQANRKEGVGPMLVQIINFPRFSHQIPPGSDPRAFDGYFLYSESGVSSDVQINTGTFLLDSSGTMVHHWPTERYMPEGTGAYLLDNGLLLRQVAPGDWLLMQNFTVGSHGVVELVDWEGNVVWEYSRISVGEHVLHHDMEPLPNGNILLLSYEAKSASEVEALGGKATSDIRWFEKILEIKPDLSDGSTTVVWQWDAADHMTSGSSSKATDKIAINVPGAGERQLHFNSIDYDPQSHRLLVSSLIYGEIFVIDHKTGKIVDRRGKGVLGGQHDARWLDAAVPHEGDFLVHNNRDGRLEGNAKPGPFGLGAFHSAVLEVKLGDGDTTDEVVWEYEPEPIDSWYGPFMSGASRLPNGNTLVVNSFNKRVFEINHQKEILLDFTIPGPGRIFRMYKLPKTHPGLRLLSPCSNLSDQ
ncbi:MAG: aryl-sulfate sulfotransferase [Planctomycetota bacterium]